MRRDFQLCREGLSRGVAVAALHRVRQMVDQISGQTVARLEAVLSPLQRERLRLLLIKHGDR